mgnify:FL=1
MPRMVEKLITALKALEDGRLLTTARLAEVAGVGLHTLKGNATHPALMEFRQMRSTQEGILWGNKATIIEFKKKHGE